jgi:hypothetical protein
MEWEALGSYPLSDPRGLLSQRIMDAGEGIRNGVGARLEPADAYFVLVN